MSDISNLNYPIWQQRYQAALVELDPQKLADRICVAENAILLRQKELAGSAEGKTERQAIDNAIRALRVLRQDNRRKLLINWKPESSTDA